MRASCFAKAAPALCLAAALVAAPLRAEGASARAGTTVLDPAFRLAAGGRAIAGPIVDAIGAPPAAWLLSEDLSLYALTDSGALAARVDLSAGGLRPGSLLSVDPFGRVLVVLDGPQGGRELSAFTRMGQAAWRARVDAVPGPAAAFPPAFGSDGRAFALSGTNLVCLSTAGLRLWSLDLPAEAVCPPGVDGLGRPCVALADGSLLIASPYGEKLVTLSLNSVARVLCPLPMPAGASPDMPSLAVGLADGRLIFLGSGGQGSAEGQTLATYRSKAATLSLAWDGAVLYGLDAGGEAFALSGTGKALWSCPTSCPNGALYLFPERLIAVGRGRAVSLSLQGEVFRELSIPGAAGTPAISPAGFAYSSGSDWVLAAYRFEKPLGVPRLVALPAYSTLPDIVSRILRFDPLASEADRQLERLDDIQNSLRSGTIGAGEPEAAAYCAGVATRELERELSEAERRHGGSALARSRACGLLGDFGSVAYREPLFRVLEADADPSVRAAACEALAALLVDPDGRSMAAFLAAAARPVDERTALVIIAAIEGMALRSGTAPSGDALRALIKLTTKPYGQTVRNRAMAALGRISGTLR